jgi:hydroxypyruvate isomerase
MPGSFLADPNEAHQLLQTWKLNNLKVQFDFYHVQRIQGDPLSFFSRLKDSIGHIQIADNPGRHQPGTGEINYPAIFPHLKEIDYNGFIGLEYIPRGDVSESLQWLRDLN